MTSIEEFDIEKYHMYQNTYHVGSRLIIDLCATWQQWHIWCLSRDGGGLLRFVRSSLIKCKRHRKLQLTRVLNGTQDRSASRSWPILVKGARRVSWCHILTPCHAKKSSVAISEDDTSFVHSGGDYMLAARPFIHLKERLCESIPHYLRILP